MRKNGKLYKYLEGVKSSTDTTKMTLGGLRGNTLAGGKKLSHLHRKGYRKVSKLARKVTPYAFTVKEKREIQE